MTFHGQEYLINSTTSGNQIDPMQTVLGNGDILVAWESQEGIDFANEIRARILNPDGSLSSPDFLVNTTELAQNDVAVTTLQNGEGLVTWSSTDDTTGIGTIHARVVDADGSTGAEFVLNPSESEVGIGTATLTDGATLVASSTVTQQGGGAEIVGHLVNTDGTGTGSEFAINTTTAGTQFQPAAAAMPDGDAFVTWASESNGHDEIYGRILNANGSGTAPDFHISSTTGIDQLGSAVGALSNDNVLVTWSQDNAIHARMFDADGTAVGSDFQVNSSGFGSDSSVTALADGRAIVVWDGSASTIYARVVNADGTMSDDQFVVNSATNTGESDPHATQLPNGEILVTWTSTGDMLNEDIHGRLLTLDNTITGTDGNDVLHGSTAAAEIYGAAGNDSITGGDGNDFLSGGTGHNLLWGGNGDDTFLGGAGTDSFAGGTGNNTVTYDLSHAGVSVNLTTDTASGGDATGDTLSLIQNVTGSAYNDTLAGDAGVNHLDGGVGNDSLTGLGGDDVLTGGAGSDHIWGGDGNDTLVGGAGADTISGGAGTNTADYSASVSAVTVNLASGTGSGGDAQGDQLSSIQNVMGSAFNDHLSGNSGVNQLTGGAGNDSLAGGGGQDTLTGGDGADTFVFKAVTDSTAGHEAQIADFSSAEGDQIDLSGIDANTHAAGDQAFGYIGSAAFSDVAGQLRYADHVLQGDVNGDGTADFQVHVNVASLAHGDFVL